MNNTVLMGRIASDIELRTTQTGKTVTSFTLAVPRRMNKDMTDFIRCIAWNKTAEFINRYFSKGRMIAIEGEIQSRSWDGQDGKKNYATEVLVRNVYFTGEKATEAPAEYESNTPINDTSWADVSDDDCPF